MNENYTFKMEHGIFFAGNDYLWFSQVTPPPDSRLSAVGKYFVKRALFLGKNYNVVQEIKVLQTRLNAGMKEKQESHEKLAHTKREKT